MNSIGIGSIRDDFRPPIPTFIHGMQLPEDLHGVDRRARSFILVPVLRFLQSEVQQGPQKKHRWNLHGRWTSPYFRLAIIFGGC